MKWRCIFEASAGKLDQPHQSTICKQGDMKLTAALQLRVWKQGTEHPGKAGR